MTALAIVRALHYGAVVQLFGAVLFATFVGRPVLATGVASDRLRSGLAAVERWSATAALLSWLVWFVLQAAAMTGGSAGEGVHGPALVTVLQATTFGHVWLFRLAIIAFVAVLAFTRTSSITRDHEGLVAVLAAFASLAALATLAGIGHAAADPGVDKLIHISVDALHAVAAGAWLGMLLPLAAALRSLADPMAVHAVVVRFSTIGVIAVATLLLSGIVNSAYLVGSWPALFGTPYGDLLMLKLALFAVMLALALANRFGSTPQLSRVGIASAGASSRIARNARGEAVLGVAVLAVVGLLGTWVPAAHDDVSWPFPFRITFADHQLPAVVQAYPTTYLRSPQRHTVASVVRGSALYAAHCAGCHGADGHGNGPAASALAMKPADLGAEHVLAHKDGDLYWWITHGIAGTPMPAFEATLDDGSRWDLVQFVKALPAASAVHGNTVAADIEAPEFTYQIGYGAQQTVPSTTAATLLVLYTLPASRARLAVLAAEAADLRRAGIRVVALPMPGEPAPATNDPLLAPIIATASPNVAKAYTLFDPASVRRDHLEVLIHREGLLRAVWHAADAPGILELLDQAAAIAGSSDRPRPSAHHHH